MVGVFNKYPVGVFNPAFTGMYLWELSCSHELNDYQICPHHSIKSGIILYGTEAYVFTQITNNDITSHLKILIRGKRFTNDMTLAQAMKLLLTYVRVNCSRTIIPSIKEIQANLHTLLGLSEESYMEDTNTYMTLLLRVYLLLFMLHYKMPLQRKNHPGSRNMSSSIHSSKKKGWYAYLSLKEQQILNNPNIFISVNTIPDDLIEGVSREEITDFDNITFEDTQNCSMFRDSATDSMLFQQTIHTNKYNRSKYRNHPNDTDSNINKNGENTKDSLKEVPTIQNLKDQVDNLISLEKHGFEALTFVSWNSRFHQIINKCGIRHSFLLESLPQCYEMGSTCGHVFQIELRQAYKNSLYLTMLDTLHQTNTSYNSNVASKFIHAVLFTNPLWDLGLQFSLARKKVGVLYNSREKKHNKYTSECVCPCSIILKEWHKDAKIMNLPNFEVCQSEVFKSENEFLEHLCYYKSDYYHQIIMRLVQSTYSVLLSKLKYPSSDHDLSETSRFRQIHKGHISLPTYVKSSLKHNTFITKKKGTLIALSRTNILKQKGSSEFTSLFSETSFSTTLEKLINCGQYNKTKKRTTPMYCFGSTITCTRYPKFCCDGKTQILPRPYQQCKPNNVGYEIIRSSWMQSFIKEVELQVLHYLQNICPDSSMKKLILFNIQLAKNIIPECLRLGDSFFTHMTIFGTVNK